MREFLQRFGSDRTHESEREHADEDAQPTQWPGKRAETSELLPIDEHELGARVHAELERGAEGGGKTRCASGLQNVDLLRDHVHGKREHDDDTAPAKPAPP